MTQKKPLPNEGQAQEEARRGVRYLEASMEEDMGHWQGRAEQWALTRTVKRQLDEAELLLVYEETYSAGVFRLR